MKKAFKVVILPTEKASQISSYKRPSYNGRLMEFAPKPTPTDEDWQKQHLYIISDDEIKEDDYILWAKNKDQKLIRKIRLSDNSNELYIIDEGALDITYSKAFMKKIVATTDTSLYKNGACYNKNMIFNIIKDYLPQIPESFIQAYIKSYNEGKPITEVNLEMETYSHNQDEVGFRIKSRPDNTVIVHQSSIEDKIDQAYKRGWFDRDNDIHQSKMYSRDKVLKLINDFDEWTSVERFNKEFKQWIQDNL